MRQFLSKGTETTKATRPGAARTGEAGPGSDRLQTLQRSADASPAALGLHALQRAADTRGSAASGGRPASGRTEGGLPVQLQSGVEQLSGVPMDDVRVHYNSAKPAQLQALAYAEGTDIHVGPGQERHLPHETWHVAQQKQGRVRPTGQIGGTAINDDPALEAEADTMGTRALQAKADPAATAQLQAGGTGAGVVQRYGVTEDPVYRVSENDKSMVPQNSSEGGNTFLATKDIIEDGAKKLEAAKSAITIEATEESIEYEKNTLFSVAPSLRDDVIKEMDPERIKKLKRINRNEEEDDNGEDHDGILALWTDCGKAARTIMGLDGTGKSPKPKTNLGTGKESDVPSSYSDEIFVKGLKAFFGTKASAAFMKEGVHYKMSKEQKVLIEPATAKQARAMYRKLGPKGRDAFDAHVGINRYVNPEIGEAYTMVTEKDMPGFKETGFTWGFHWAGVIAKDGPDNVTIEGYAIDPTDEIEEAMKKLTDDELEKEIEKIIKEASEHVNRDWVFQMYGTEKGQTFHDDHLDGGTHGNRATTFNATQ